MLIYKFKILINYIFYHTVHKHLAGPDSLGIRIIPP